MDFDLTALFSAPGAVAGGAAVAAVVAALKGLVLPTSWQHGRAPMLVAAFLSAALVVAAEQVAARAVDGAVLVTDVLTWATVYTASIGTHQTVSKATRVATGTTDPTGPDRAP